MVRAKEQLALAARGQPFGYVQVGAVGPAPRLLVEESEPESGDVVEHAH